MELNVMKILEPTTILPSDTRIGCDEDTGADDYPTFW